jgi:hypothetical protein
MDFDGAIVLFDGLAVVTRTEVSISLEHDDETLCHSVARKVMRTYSFLAFFCLDAPGFNTLRAFDSSRLDQLFLFGCLRRARASGFGFLFLIVLGSHYCNNFIFIFFRNLRATVSFRKCLTSWGTKEKVVKGRPRRWLDLSPLLTRVPFHIDRFNLRGLAATL